MPCLSRFVLFFICFFICLFFFLFFSCSFLTFWCVFQFGWFLLPPHLFGGRLVCFFNLGCPSLFLFCSYLLFYSFISPLIFRFSCSFRTSWFGFVFVWLVSSPPPFSPFPPPFFFGGGGGGGGLVVFVFSTSVGLNKIYSR